MTATSRSIGSTTVTAMPKIDGRLIVDGETYSIRGLDWLLKKDDSSGDDAALYLHARRRARRRMNLAGATVRTEHVRFLAAMVDGELAAKLNRAITNNNEIVALSAADRKHLLEVLTETTPGALLELRTVLVKQRSDELKREAQAAGSDATRTGHAAPRVRPLSMRLSPSTAKPDTSGRRARCVSHASLSGATTVPMTRTRSARPKSPTRDTRRPPFELRTWDIRYPQGQERITDAFYDEVTP